MRIAVTVANFLADSDPMEISPEKPYTGAVEFLHDLFTAGHYVIIHDTRANEHQKYVALRMWLIQNSFDFSEIWTAPGKPEADLVLDPLSPGCPTDYQEILKLL